MRDDYCRRAEIKKALGDPDGAITAKRYHLGNVIGVDPKPIEIRQ